MNGDSYRRRSASDRKSAKVDVETTASSVNHNPDNSGNIMEEITE